MILQTAYSVGEWHYGCGLATICFSASVHTAKHCRAFRDDDILKCLEQFCSLYDLRTYIKESYTA